MGFFENVKNTITETSQELTQKAKETTEIYRLNNANKSNEKEIEKLMYQIGVSYYSNYKEECVDKFSELTQQVENLQNEIAGNKEAIEKLSTEEVCANCGKKVNPGSKFCIYCGATVVQNNAESVELSGEVCSNCGCSLEAGAVFCTNCGTRVEK